MRKSFKNWISRQREDFNELYQLIGLKNSMQQMAIGAALCFLLLVACCSGEVLNKLGSIF